MAATLITLDDVLPHIRWDDDASSEMEQKMEQAESFVLGFLEKKYEGWTVETVPPEVRGAILMVLAFLWENKGDADPTGDPLTPAVRSLLRFYRNPVVA